MAEQTSDLLLLLAALRLELELDLLRRLHRRMRLYETSRISDESRRLIQLATEKCTNQTVLKWLKSESDTFVKLEDMFQFLKKHMDEEEKKNHSDTVDITLVAHGCIRDFMIPACCYLPLPSICDVVLYAPWNCATSDLDYAIATGRLRPQHRVFICNKKNGCKLPDEKHQPVKLSDHWNSMKKAGDQLVPNITLSPLRPNDPAWESFEIKTKKYGPVGRNRIVIPFILPGKESESVPFSVITLALSLVLQQSRFKATIHLDTCLSDQSDGDKFDKKYLEKQYACAIDDTWMTCSPDCLDGWCILQ